MFGVEFGMMIFCVEGGTYVEGSAIEGVTPSVSFLKAGRYGQVAVHTSKLVGPWRNPKIVAVLHSHNIEEYLWTVMTIGAGYKSSYEIRRPRDSPPSGTDLAVKIFEDAKYYVVHSGGKLVPY